MPGVCCDLFRFNFDGDGMIVACECGKSRDVQVFPLHCSCGRTTQAPAGWLKATGRAANIGTQLRRMLGCGCTSIPFAEWDANGLGWCRDNQEQIVAAISGEPKTKTGEQSARRMVAKALQEANE